MVVETKSERRFCFPDILFMTALTCQEVYDVFAVAADGISDFVCFVLDCALKM